MFRTKKRTYASRFFGHCKVEFILISLSGLLLETSETVLLRVVVAGSEDIVLVFFEDAILLTMCELRTLLVVAPMQRISERRGDHEERANVT